MHKKKKTKKKVEIQRWKCVFICGMHLYVIRMWIGFSFFFFSIYISTISLALYPKRSLCILDFKLCNILIPTYTIFTTRMNIYYKWNLFFIFCSFILLLSLQLYSIFYFLFDDDMYSRVENITRKSYRNHMSNDVTPFWIDLKNYAAGIRIVCEEYERWEMRWCGVVITI